MYGSHGHVCHNHCHDHAQQEGEFPNHRPAGHGPHGHGHGHFHHGWALLTHEERVEHLVEVKQALEAQLAEIQKTLDLLQSKPVPSDSTTSPSDPA
ncbi:MAG: hypothetical protein QMC95_16010 [Desulfitobacteriaceae bacterium]|nr:hypothetical protein [Desulfitobacteriaceae bacterium]MDI6880318.1 hypothetical protein [Desulfitobacteriaceae bacterium]MDI6915698.1 hypothetical protein [Desulfitobacteriaceae bacterium]